MCKFLASMSQYSSDIIGAPKRNPNLEMFLKPCKTDKDWYRVRLLNFSPSSGGNRSDAHITRVVHSAWKLDPATGKKKQHKLVCSAYTPWVEVEGDKRSSCKVCSWQNQQWAIYNESGKTDKSAVAKANSVKRQFEAIVPVYVVHDPNYERNIGKLKVIIFNDKDEYMDLRKKIQNKLREVPVFNGTGAVNLLIHVTTEEVELASGKKWTKNKIDRMTFAKSPTDIPAINEKLIDAFPFDDTYFMAPSQEDIDEFYSDFCAISNDDIPDEDEIPVYSAPKKTVVEKMTLPSNAEAASKNDISTEEIDELVGSESSKASADEPADELTADPDEVGLEVDEPKTSAPAENDDSSDILKELGF